MADAFRGLTIRIGADTRPIKSSLESVTKSASSAQKQLKQMQNALKFDKSNMSAASKALDLMGDKASLSARGFALAEKALRQAGFEAVNLSKNTDISARHVFDLAKQTDKVYSETEKLRSEYNRVDGELAHIHEAVAKVIAQQQNLSEAKGLKEMRKLVNQVSNGSEKAAKSLRGLMKIAFDKNITGMSASNKLGIADRFNVKRGDFANIWGFITNSYPELKKAHNELNNDLNQMYKVEGLRSLQAQITAYKNEVRESVHETNKLMAEIHTLGSTHVLRETASDVEVLNSALEETRADARSAESAFDKMPASIDSAKAMLKSYGREQELLSDKIATLKRRLDEIRKVDPMAEHRANSKNVYLDYERAAKSADDFGTKLELASKRAELLEKELDDLKRTEAPVEKIQKLEAELKDARAEADKLRVEYEKAGDTLKKAAMAKEVRKAKNEIRETEAAAKSLDQSFSKLSMINRIAGAIRTAGYGLYTTVTPAITIGLSKMVDAAETIDAAYRDMRKTVNGTEEEFEHLKDAAIEFSRTHVTTADTVLEIESLGGQLGIQARNLEGFANVVSNLDIATNIDADDLATYVGQLSNIMRDIDQSDPDQYQRDITSFSDALVRLGNNSAAQESNIMKVMMRIASLGNISGFTTPQLLAISTAVAATGQGAEAAGTAISRTFSNIEAAVGKGGDKLELFAKVSGMSAKEFAEAWNTDPIKAFNAFIGGLKKIDETGGSVDNTLANLGINSVRQKQALEGLTNTYDVLQESLTMSGDAWKGFSTIMSDGSIEQAGDAMREAERKSEGFSGAIQKMRNNAVALAEAMSEGILPFVNILNAIFTGLTGFVRDLPGPLKSVLVLVAGVFAAAGPMAIALGAVISGVARAKEAWNSFLGIRTLAKATGDVMSWLQLRFELLGNSALLSSTKLGAFSKTLSKVSTTKLSFGIMAAVAAIGFVVQAIDDANKEMERYRKATEGLEEASRGLASASDVVNMELEDAGKLTRSTAESYQAATDAAEEAKEANIKLADSFHDAFSSANENAGLIQYYSDRILDLSNSEDFNKAKLAELNDALEHYNQLAGTSYSVVDETTGALNVQTEAFEKNAAAAKLNAYAKAAATVLEEAVAAKLRTGQAFASVTAEIEKMIPEWKELNDIISNGGTLTGEQWNRYMELDGQLQGLQKDQRELTAEYEANKEAVDRASASYEEYTRLATEAANNSKALETSAKDFSDALMEAGESEMSFDVLAAKLNQSAEGLAMSLSLAGVSATEMRNLGSDAFLKLWDAAGNSAQGVANALHLMSAAGITDIDELTGETWKLNAATGTLTDGVHYFKITDDGSVVDIKEQVDELNSTAEDTEDTYSIDYDTGDVIDAQGDVAQLERDLNRIDGTTYSATLDVDTSNASMKISLLASAISGAKAIASSIGNAAGGIVPANAAGGLFLNAVNGIPRNASGGINGIVTGATLTNVGWVGEAGDEAVFHMKNAGGAIVPLSNRQHVRPFAKAVAAEMPYTSSGTVYNFSVDGAIINDDPHMRGLFIDLLSEMQRKAAMNRG